MKHEWKKYEKNLYGVKQSPRIVDIPMQQFIMIEGKGNPNDQCRQLSKLRQVKIYLYLIIFI